MFEIVKFYEFYYIYIYFYYYELDDNIYKIIFLKLKLALKHVYV